VKRFGGLGLVKSFGILRCAQDDGGNLRSATAAVGVTAEMAGCEQEIAVGKATADSSVALGNYKMRCGLTTRNEEPQQGGLGGLLLFEGEGEFFPFGEEGGALGAERF
jgi:hypothetical protein